MGEFTMAYWLSQEGYYYEHDTPMTETDFQVPQRPSKDHKFVNGEWMVIPCIKPNTRSMWGRPTIQYPYYCSGDQHYQQQYQPMPIEPVYYPMPQQQAQQEKSEGLSISEKTKLTFGLREIILIITFLITGALSWQDTNSRIVKLEEDKRVLETKVKTIETDIQTINNTVRTETQKLSQQIRELEQIIFMNRTGK